MASVYGVAKQLLAVEWLSGTTTYCYDLAGNRLSIETPISEIDSYAFYAMNHNTSVELPSNEIVTYVLGSS